MRLLFTGGGGAGSEPLYALLKDRYDVHFCDANPARRPPSIPVERFHHVPYAMDGLLVNPRFLPALIDRCYEFGIDVLVPGVDEELRPIAMSRFPCEVLLPETSFVMTHLDKLASMRELDRAGIPVPLTDRLTFRGQQNKRFLVKPREGRGSRGVLVVGPDYLAQELLTGQEYTVTMLADKTRRLRAIVPVKVLEKRGVTVNGQVDYDAEVIDACGRLHKANPCSGLFNVQGIKTDGGFLPFEINPRISTTACLAMWSGVDLIALWRGEGEVGTVATQARLTRTQRADGSWATGFAA